MKICLSRSIYLYENMQRNHTLYTYSDTFACVHRKISNKPSKAISIITNAVTNGIYSEMSNLPKGRNVIQCSSILSFSSCLASIVYIYPAIRLDGNWLFSIPMLSMVPVDLTPNETFSAAFHNFCHLRVYLRPTCAIANSN